MDTDDDDSVATTAPPGGGGVAADPTPAAGAAAGGGAGPHAVLDFGKAVRMFLIETRGQLYGRKDNTTSDKMLSAFLTWCSDRWPGQSVARERYDIAADDKVGGYAFRAAWRDTADAKSEGGGWATNHWT
eukprot:gene46623-37915_t